jgi:diguanylate cyclase (GGDEF)-like protein/PAS domain S-box-containing protein
VATEEFYKSLLDNLSDGVYFVDLERRILYWNRGAEHITGFAATDVIGQRCADGLLMHVDGEGCLLCHDETCPAAESMRSRTPLERRVFLHHRDGHRIPVLARITPLRGDNGEIVGAVEVFSDDSVAVAAADQIVQLRQAAMLDPLTGIGNRRHGEVELANRLGTLERYGWTLGVLMVDVDGFKRVNDEHGHEAGDAVLHMVAQTLSRNVRAFDAVCRWGGEEFLVLLTNITEKDLARRAEQLRWLVEKSALVRPPQTLRVTASIGATMARSDDTPHTVVERADSLMYVAKREGRNRISADAAV